MDFKSLLIIVMSSVLVNNYVLTKFLGICPFLGVSKKTDQAVGMGIAVTFVMLCATAVTWPIQTYILEKFNLGYVNEIRHFMESARDNKDAKVGLRGIDGYEAIRVINLIYKSAREGIAIKNDKI